MMKKLILILAIGFVATTLFGQDKSAKEDAITVESYPIKLALECDELDMAADLIVTSTCEGEVTVTKKDVDASGGCVGTIIRTWKIKDACGNKKTVEQYITKLDNTMPVIDDVEDKTIINYRDVIAPKAVDNCYGAVEVKHTDEYQNVNGKIVTIRTYTAVDGCGNTATKVQKLTMNSPD
ncbi:MAG: hypothetical protein ACI81Y_002201 [Glaciecola sp.]|jgi:hypothetical protein